MPSNCCSTGLHPAGKPLAWEGVLRWLSRLGRDPQSSLGRSPCPPRAPLRHPRVLPAALHQAQQPALHTVPRRQEALHRLRLRVKERCDSGRERGQSGRSGDRRGGSGRDKREGAAGTTRRGRGQPGAGSAAAPRHRGRSKDTMRQVSPAARLSWMATDWSISGPAARRTALPWAGTRRLPRRSGRLSQGDAARFPPAGPPPLPLRYRCAPGPAGNNGAAAGTSAGSGRARQGRRPSGYCSAGCEGRGRHGSARLGTAQARPCPAAAPAAEPRASRWPLPEGKGDGEEEPLGLADMGKVNFHRKSRDALIFSSNSIIFVVVVEFQDDPAQEPGYSAKRLMRSVRVSAVKYHQSLLHCGDGVWPKSAPSFSYRCRRCESKDRENPSGFGQ